MSKQSPRIRIDTGGTFADVVVFNEATEALTTMKTPSTPSNPADGFINGIGKVLEMLATDQESAMITASDISCGSAEVGRGVPGTHSDRMRAS